MEFTKRVLEQQDHCYAVNVMEADGEPYVSFAVENHDSCFAWDCETFTKRKSVWEQPGGTMSMVPVPERDGGFLAVQKFFRLYGWGEARPVWVWLDGQDNYGVKELFTFPYLHRFDLLEGNGIVWFICCTLATHKRTREDWSQPGGVYAVVLPADEKQPVELTALQEDFYQNHGYAWVRQEGYDTGLVTCEQGIFLFTPPEGIDGEWSVEQVMNQPTGDADLIDIDGDGEMEIVAIEAFHGRYFRIYKCVEDQWIQAFEHPETSKFYHVVRAGIPGGQPVFVGGCRRGKQQLSVVRYNREQREFEVITVDEGVGPSNAIIYNGSQQDCILAANREAAQAVVYVVKEWPWDTKR